MVQNVLAGVRVYPHRASESAATATSAVVAASSNAGVTYIKCLEISPRPIPKRHHRPALDDAATTADADARCVYSFILFLLKYLTEKKVQQPSN